MTHEQIQKEMERLAEHGSGMATMARAMSSLSLTLAHHAAWTEERFEGMDKRFDALDRKFEAIGRRFDEVDTRFEGVGRRFEQVDVRFEQVDRRFDAVDRKMDSGQTVIMGELGKLSARVDLVVTHAMRQVSE